jgi:stage II sporulation protein D
MGQAAVREHPELATITSLELLGRTGSDRVRGVRLAGPEGALMLTGNEFRRIFGYTKVRSTWFDIEEVNGGLQLTGQGSGHGVGMCQWGAQGMAREGAGYEEILAHYYGDATLHTAYE